MTDEKRKWLSEIRAVEYPEAVKYIYSFPDGYETYTLTEEYVENTPLSELRERYEKDREMAEAAIRWRILREQNRFYYTHVAKDPSFQNE